MQLLKETKAVKLFRGKEIFIYITNYIVGFDQFSFLLPY